MPITLSYRHTLYSIGAYIRWDGDSTAADHAASPAATLNGTAAVADIAGARGGKAFDCNDALGVVSLPGDTTQWSDVKQAFGFRFRIPSYDTNKRVTLFALGAQGSGSNQNDADGIFCLIWGDNDGVGLADTMWLRLLPETAQNGRDLEVPNPSIPSDTWVNVIVEQQDNLDDWDIVIDGTRHSFSYRSGAGTGLERPLASRNDWFGGSVQNSSYFSREQPTQVEEIWVCDYGDWSGFGSRFPQSYVDMIKAADGDQETDPPDNTTVTVSEFDQERSGPTVGIVFPTAASVTTADNQWRTAVTKRALPYDSTDKVALRFTIDNYSSQHIIFGICGDTPFSNLPDDIVGNGLHAGRITPSVGIYTETGTIYVQDYASLSSSAIGLIAGNAFEVEVDMEAKIMRFYDTNACGTPVVEQAFDFGTDWVRFCIGVRKTGGNPQTTVTLVGENFTPCNPAAIPVDDWRETRNFFCNDPVGTEWGECPSAGNTAWGECTPASDTDWTPTT